MCRSVWAPHLLGDRGADAFGLKTKVVGVVSQCRRYASPSSRQGGLDQQRRYAGDGMACRVPVDDAVAQINKGVGRIVELTEDEIKAAMRIYSTTSTTSPKAPAPQASRGC